MDNRLLSAFAVLALTLCAVGGVILMSEDSDAAGSGTALDPYDSVSGTFACFTAKGSPSADFNSSNTYYVLLGSSFNLTCTGLTSVVCNIPGLSVNNNVISGTTTTAGSYDIYDSSVEMLQDLYERQGEVGEFDTRIHFVIVSEEEDIDFTSPAAVSGISGGSISYTAKTNIGATFSEAGGTAASWLSVNSSTGKVTGTLPLETSMKSYTYTIRATSETNSSNTATQTITINVYPVAKITATSTSVTGTEDEAISTITLSGNVAMSFSRSSGSFPPGITLSGSTISGTPTSSGDYTVTIRGTSTAGPSQTATIQISFDIEPAESDLTLSLSDPKSSYMTGESVSLNISCNVSGSTFEVSGTASSWMSVSGSKVVGSVPSTYTDVTSLMITVTAETPKGQTATASANFSVEPRLAFTSVPTADCIINPVQSSVSTTASRASPLLLEVDAIDSTEFSFPDTMTIQATFTGENAETVTWYWGDGKSDVGNKFTHTYEQPGTYTILLVASNDLGDSELELTVTVGESPYSPLYIGIIVVLLVVAVYLVYRLVKGGDRRGRR